MTPTLIAPSIRDPVPRPVREFKLSNGLWTLLDDGVDFPAVMGTGGHFPWHHMWTYAPGAKGYAYAHVKKADGTPTTLTMHVWVARRMGLVVPPDHQIDHEDNDGLNNCRGNLRVATRSQNLGNQGLSANNTSGYKGVSWANRMKCWRAGIRVNGKHRFIGHYTDAELAAAAYDAAAAGWVQLRGPNTLLTPRPATTEDP